MMHSAPHKRDDKPQAQKQLNLTACIDIVFLLLIFFIVTIQFPAPEGSLAATLSGGEDPLPRPEIPLRVQVSSVGETGYRLDLDGHPTRPVSFGDLINMLSQLQDKPAAGRHGLYADDNLVVIAPGNQVRWQHVVNAYNASRKAGYSKVTFESAR